MNDALLLALMPSAHEAAPGLFVADKAMQAPWMCKGAHGAATTLRQRGAVPFTTSSQDLPLYRMLLEKNLRDMPRDARIVELGAGDGRITHELLHLGFENIIAVEGHPGSLRALHESLSEAQRRHVRLLHADMLTLSFPPQSVDVLVSVEALSYLNAAFDDVLARMAAALTANGILLHAELMTEGNLLYALATQDTANITSLLEGHWTTPYGPARTFTEEEMAHIYAGAGLRMSECFRIPTLHGLLAAAWNKHKDTAPELRGTLERTAQALRGCDVPRAMFFAGRKAACTTQG